MFESWNQKPYLEVMKSFNELMTQGVGDLERGDARSACANFKRALKKNKNNPDALHLLGLAEHYMGQSSRAIHSIKKALRFSGKNVQYLNNLGQIEMAAGLLESAVSTYSEALKNAPNQIEVMNNLGNALIELDRAAEAICFLERAHQIAPHYLPAAYNLARAYFCLEEFEKPVLLCEEVLKADSNYPDVRTLLGLAYHRIRRTAEGIKVLNDAIAIYPHGPEPFRNLILIFDEAGRSKEALETVERALTAFPDMPDFIERQAVFYRRLGDFAEAAARARELTGYPGWRGSGYVMLSHMRALTTDEGDLKDIQKLLNAPGLEDTERADLNFALYALEDGAGNWDEAFNYLSTANNLMRKQRPFDAGELKRLHDDKIIQFTDDMIKAPRPFEDGHPSVVFIVGMPRSGSTLIERILASHPQTMSVGEASALIEVEHKIGLVDLHPNSQDELDAKICDARKAYFDQLPPVPSHCDFLIDKQLSNYRNVGLINLIFPESRIIHAVRDPMASGFSCYEQRFTEGQEFSFDLDNIGTYSIELMRMMNHWKAISNVPILDVRYEEIVQSQRDMTEKILAYCGMPWDESCLRFFMSGGEVRTASSVQVRQPLYKDKIASWQRYESKLGALKRVISHGS